MNNMTNILEYKCPCCNAGLSFSGDVQQLTCEYCDNTFELDAVKAYNEAETAPESFEWEPAQEKPWSEDEQTEIQSFQCPSCGGELLTDQTTAATFCPFCGNPTILPVRLTDTLKPDGVLPFQTTKEDAKRAFLQRKTAASQILHPGAAVGKNHRYVRSFLALRLCR